MIDDFSLKNEVIKEKLNTTSFKDNIYFYEKATSTFDLENETLKKDHTIIIAKTQTNASGRFNRKWESDNGGVYFSLIIRPKEKCDFCAIYSIIGALCVKRAVFKYINCSIKWPNDIIDQNNKKLCGILTKIRYENDTDYYLNIGIGVNVNTQTFPKELPYATSIYKSSGFMIDENEFLKDVVCEFEKLISKDKKEIIKEYKNSSATIGKEVKIVLPHGDEFYIAKCIDIDFDGSLIVEKEDKTIVKLNYGEVSVRGIYDGI